MLVIESQPEAVLPTPSDRNCEQSMPGLLDCQDFFRCWALLGFAGVGSETFTTRKFSKTPQIRVRTGQSRKATLPETLQQAVQACIVLSNDADSSVPHLADFHVIRIQDQWLLVSMMESPLNPRPLNPLGRLGRFEFVTVLVKMPLSTHGPDQVRNSGPSVHRF